jgi:hypothetical protein
MSINQSQPRMRIHPILLHSRFYESQQRRLFVNCSMLASLRRALKVAREACSTPVPRMCAEKSPTPRFFPIFPTHKTTEVYGYICAVASKSSRRCTSGELESMAVAMRRRRRRVQCCYAACVYGKHLGLGLRRRPCSADVWQNRVIICTVAS